MSNLGLDLSRGLQLFAQEKYGDWYRDPWGWPEFRWIQANVEKISAAEFFDPKSKELKYEPVFHKMEVPKTHLGTRPAVIQDPLSRFWYLAAVGASMKSLHGDLAEFVFGWRESRGGSPVDSGSQSEAATNDKEWANYIDHVRGGLSLDYGLQADITSFFASIDTDRLLNVVRDRIGQNASFAIISHVVRSHSKLSQRSGLPQRSFGSAALANLYMLPIDNVLASSLRRHGVSIVARWMDDIVAFGDEVSLYQLYLELQEISRMNKLELNSAKGRLARSEEIVRAIDLEQVRDVHIAWKELKSDYDGNLDAEASEVSEEDVEKLIELEDVALREGADAARPWLRATLSSLTKSENFDRARAWLDNAKNIPHAADSLGRYLRGAGAEGVERQPGAPSFFDENDIPAWGELSEWLIEHLKSGWCRVDWVKAQLALAIPTSKVSSGLRDILREWLTTSNNMQLVAMAGQRISELDPDMAYEIVRSRADEVHDPLLERVLALTLLQARKDRNLVETLVKRSPSNVFLARWMEANSWKPAEVPRDFDHD